MFCIDYLWTDYEIIDFIINMKSDYEIMSYASEGFSFNFFIYLFLLGTMYNF